MRSVRLVAACAPGLRRGSEVLAGAGRVLAIGVWPTGPYARPHRQRRPTTHLLELCPRSHLLRNERGLDAVEQAFEPANQLRLRDAQLGLARCLTLIEGQRQPLQLVDELGREAVLQLHDRPSVDLLEPPATRL